MNPLTSNDVLSAQRVALLKDQEKVPDIPIIPDKTPEACEIPTILDKTKEISKEEPTKSEVHKDKKPEDKVLKHAAHR